MTSSLQHALFYFHHLFYLGGGFKIWDYLSICLVFFKFPYLPFICVLQTYTRAHTQCEFKYGYVRKYVYINIPLLLWLDRLGCNVEGECFARLIMEF